jgi:putative transposase
MSPSERREMIRKENTDLSLTRQCKLLKISRSSNYYTSVGFDPATLDLMHEIDRIFTKYPFFGSRQIAAYLPQSGFSAGRHRVRRLMGIMGLQAIYKDPNTSKKHPQHRVYPYLLRKLAITRPTQVWGSDITYIPVKHGFLYLVAIMAQSAVLAALKYAGCQLLCRSTGGGNRPTRQARDNEHGPGQPIHRRGLGHDIDQG